MKLHNLFAGLLLATSVSLSAGALAADAEKPAADVAGEKTEKATTPAKKKIKPHSHMEEKGMGAPVSGSTDADKKADAPKSDKPRADKDKSKHLHPRDGK